MNEMLHIITPAYRYHLLEKVYRSIPLHPDIVWHIVKTSRREKIAGEFLNDSRVRLYEIDVADSDTISKRNYVFEHIKDGYFFLLDDDTIFMSAAYDCYRHYAGINFVGMVIGAQAHRNMNIRLRPTYPEENLSIDSGNVISHFSVLGQVKWEWTPPNSQDTRDFIFWNNCFKYFGKGKTEITPEIISVYNFLN